MTVAIPEVPDTAAGCSRFQWQVTKHDTNVLNPIPVKGILIGSTAGNLVYEPYDNPGVTITLPVVANQYLPIVARIIKTATTAAEIFGLA